MAQSTVMPKEIKAYLEQQVLGQARVLKSISVAMYKHIHRLPAGNVLLIGNSGTGKTTIMNAVRDFYQDTEGMEYFRVMVIMNANMLIGEDGTDSQCGRLFRLIEDKARRLLGRDLTEEELKHYMEHATVCLDEVDKISSKVAGRVNVTGIAVQQALLTIMEGETVLHETTVVENGKTKRVKIPLSTAHILYICGGAFEELYDQVYNQLMDPKEKRRLKSQVIMNEGAISFQANFNLQDYLMYEDLFRYGMAPQFISRFSSLEVLNNLGRDVLKTILLDASDSPYRASQAYFQHMGIRLSLEGDAAEVIAAKAAENTRMGARSLREVFSRMVTDVMFDPFSSDRLEDDTEGKRIRISGDYVKEQLKLDK